jgi:hypothetical protein
VKDYHYLLSIDGLMGAFVIEEFHKLILSDMTLNLRGMTMLTRSDIMRTGNQIFEVRDLPACLLSSA